MNEEHVGQDVAEGNFSFGSVAWMAAVPKLQDIIGVEDQDVGRGDGGSSKAIIGIEGGKVAVAWDLIRVDGKGHIVILVDVFAGWTCLGVSDSQEKAA